MTDLLTSGTTTPPPVRIARQPIFDVDGHVAAHELLFRGTSAASADLAAPQSFMDQLGGGPQVPDAQDRATSQVISATFVDFGVDVLGAGKPLYINMTRPFLVGDYVLPFGPDGVVLEVLEHIVVDAELLAGLGDLRARGFSLAVDDYVGEPARRSLLPLVDIVKVDLSALRGPLEALLADIREVAPSVTLLAERVEDAADLPRLREVGFTLFQGFAFARPTTLETARLSPSQLVCMRLLRALADPESTTDDFERIIAADPGLSLRVLRTANSAGAAATRHITSLRQAVVMLGPGALSAWVMLTLMGGLGSGRREDLVLVLTRAAACEELAGAHAGLDPSEAYTAGMLSGVATVLCVSKAQVAADAGMDEDMTSAIAEGTGAIGALVRAVECHEVDDEPGLALTEVAPFDVSRAYLSGLGVAMATVESVLGSDI